MIDGTEIGVWFLPTVPARQVAKWAKLAEDLGFSFVGIADGQMIWRDLYVSLALAAGATTRVKLGPWVTNPVTRHPTVTINAMCSLDEQSEGRAFLGMGSGDGALKSMGLDHAKLDTVVEAVKLMKRLNAGEAVETPTGTIKLLTARGGIPVYWAAANPRSFMYGGQHTDGVIASGWIVPEVLTKVRDYIHQGAAAGGKDPKRSEVIFSTAISVGPDREQSLTNVKPFVARALAHRASTWIPGWTEADFLKFKEQYDFYHHFKSDHDLATLVPDHMVQKKAIAGSPPECRDQIRMISAGGFNKICMLPMGDTEAVMRTAAAEVLGKL